jgi:hypothetical protein
VNDRRVLNASFGSCDLGRRGAISRSAYGPYTTAYNCFNRCRRGGVWGRMLNALAVAHDAAVLLIHTSILRVHQHAACRRQSMGRLGWKYQRRRRSRLALLGERGPAKSDRKHSQYRGCARPWSAPAHRWTRLPMIRSGGRVIPETAARSCQHRVPMFDLRDVRRGLQGSRHFVRESRVSVARVW